MKLLIAFDGSDCSKTAIHSLTQAGLPTVGIDAHVLSLGEYSFESLNSRTPLEKMWTLEMMQSIVTDAITKAKCDAAEGVELIRGLFPKWNITASTGLESAATAILRRAAADDTDLIVMGSHGRSLLKRISLGSVSLRVMAGAQCSVRIVKEEPASGELVILLAFDGSPGSHNAIRALLRRDWPSETYVHILAVADSTLLAAWDYLSIPKDEVWNINNLDETKLEHVMHSVEHELSKKFHAVTSSLRIGSPTKSILETASAIGASSIFLGATGLSGFERLLLGSVAHGVASRAHCTVEVIR